LVLVVTFPCVLFLQGVGGADEGIYSLAPGVRGVPSGVKARMRLLPRFIQALKEEEGKGRRGCEWS
jgi:hypothetical protein